MNSTLSFESSADSKNILRNALNTVEKGLPSASNVLSVGCKVGGVASIVFPPAAPVAGGVCAASQVVGTVNGIANRR